MGSGATHSAGSPDPGREPGSGVSPPGPSAEAHYFFPPAAAYRLNACLFRLKSDDAFRGAFAADPDRVLAEAGLEPGVAALLRTLDRDRLVALGAHPYLVFMAGLRLRMDGAPAEFEFF